MADEKEGRDRKDVVVEGGKQEKNQQRKKIKRKRKESRGWGEEKERAKETGPWQRKTVKSQTRTQTEMWQLVAIFLLQFHFFCPFFSI